MPWNPHSANAGLCAILEAGRLHEAAAAIEAMAGSGAPLRAEVLHSLLLHASRCGSSAACLSVYDALVARSPTALGASPRLLVMPHLPQKEWRAFLLRGIAECREPTGVVLLQAALVLVVAAAGDAAEAVAWLEWLEREGVPLEEMDGRAPHELTRLLRAMLLAEGGARLEVDELALLLSSSLRRHVPFASQSDAEAALGSSGTRRAANKTRADAKASSRLRKAGAAAAAAKAAAPAPNRADESRPYGNGSLWNLALRACGTRVAAAAQICDAAMAATSVLDSGSHGAAAAVVELLGVCRLAADPHAALLALRRIDADAAPVEAVAEAHVRAVESCGLDGRNVAGQTTAQGGPPDMELTMRALDAMPAAALNAAAPGQLLRLYVTLIRGFGANFDLDSAHEAFTEGLGWLQLHARGPSTGTGAGAGTAAAIDGSWSVEQAAAAERALHREMIEARRRALLRWSSARLRSL